MCFSGQISLALSVLLLVIYVISRRAARSKQQQILAYIPLLLSIQQNAEAMLWFALNAGHSGIFARYTYLFFALIVWPLWIPLSFAAVEPLKQRENMLWGLGLLGGLVAAYFTGKLFCTGALASLQRGTIVYTLGLPIYESYLATAGYFGATVLPFFITSMPYGWILGLSLTVAFILSYLLYYNALISVWCFFAALLGSIVYGIIRLGNNNRA